MKHLVKVINAARLIASAILFCLSIASNWHRFNVNSAVYLFKKNWTQLL